MHEHDPSTTWWNDDAFWTAFAPMMFSQARWDGTPAEIDGVLGLAPVTTGATVLDLACGPGRHSLELRRRGFGVVGVDNSEGLLDRARQRGRDEGLDVEWVHADMRTFRRPEAFDLAVNLFTSFGYFDDPDDDTRVLHNIRASLRPGGRFVIDCLGTEVLARKFSPRDWNRMEDGSLLLQERILVDGWSRIDNRWIRVDEDGAHTFRVNHRLFTGTQLRDLLNATGFDDVQLFGSLAGTPYDHQAARLVAVCRRPEATD